MVKQLREMENGPSMHRLAAARRGFRQDSRSVCGFFSEKPNHDIRAIPGFPPFNCMTEKSRPVFLREYQYAKNKKAPRVFPGLGLT
jgi:hypothetical protein